MADKAEKKIDPFDVEALEKSLNDSATRVSTIWVSFLLFGLYLFIAAVNTTHPQLFLEDPIKLPVLNVDLPLLGFFFLAPAMFVTFHTYILLQILLLARTGAVYNEAIERAVSNESYQARIRQRLANTLFAQMFAGSPREREGVLGMLLRLIAWITLAIAPILVLLTFQIKFLPYHGASVTWVHRFLVAADLIAVILLWPAVLEPHRDIAWRHIALHRIALAMAMGCVFCSIVLLTFPGEPHASWTRYQVTSLPPSEKHWDLEMCNTRSAVANIVPANFDRLVVPGGDFVDDDRASKLEAAARKRGDSLWVGERIRSFGGRDLSCGRFGGTDLRFSDFSGVTALGANFVSADLQGTNFSNAKLQDAIFVRARLQGTNFYRAGLERAVLRDAELNDSLLLDARLHGAILTGAKLDGAKVSASQLDSAIRN
jgi:hypothetical protein